LRSLPISILYLRIVSHQATLPRRYFLKRPSENISCLIAGKANHQGISCMLTSPIQSGIGQRVERSINNKLRHPDHFRILKLVQGGFWEEAEHGESENPSKARTKGRIAEERNWLYLKPSRIRRCPGALTPTTLHSHHPSPLSQLTIRSRYLPSRNGTNPSKN
jgi:hypothetical protein